MRLRNFVLGLATGGAILIGTVLGAVPAQAAPATVACTHPCHPPTSPGYTYITDYYWASACNDTGNQGINAHRWSSYQCTGGGQFENYELWVK